MNTLDYEKYLNLIKNNKFEEAAIYKNSTVPNTLYKYYSLYTNNEKDIKDNELKLSDLGNQKIKLHKLNDFNDPFEGKFLIFEKEVLVEKGWDINFIEKFYDMFLSLWNITCFSDTNEQNMPMWAYYANNHKGFCVQYEFTDSLKNNIFPVSYEEDRKFANSLITNSMKSLSKVIETGTYLNDKDNLINLLLFLSVTAKHKSWTHEKEYRLMVPDEDISASAKNIFIGLYCENKYRQKLIEIGKKSQCNVYEMQIDRNSQKFELQKKVRSITSE